MNIQGKIVTLRAIELSDLPLLAKWANSPEIWHWLCGWHFPYSTLSTENYIKNINNNNQKYQNFAIDTKEFGLIGTTNLVDIDWKNRNAISGIMIGEQNAQGKGYALDAIMAIMRYAFKELGLNRLDADMIAYNERSIDFYMRKCGWQLEGRKKDWFYRNGQYYDKVICGITHQQYDEFLKNNPYWDN